MTADQDDRLAAWVRRYAIEAGHDDNLDAFVRHVDGAIASEIPEIAADPVLAEDLHASTRAQFRVFLTLLERGEQELLLPPQAIDFALSVARRHLDLAILLKVYRIAARSVWEFFTRVAASVPDDGPDRTEVLVYLWNQGGSWINDAIEQLIGVFDAEREAARTGVLAQRNETVRALLRGDHIPLDDGAALINHPLRAHHTSVVIWSTTGPSADVLVTLTKLATTLAHSVAATPLIVPAGRGETWNWLATSRPLDSADLVAAVLAAAPTEGIQVAIGNPGEGLEGFRESHREAVEVQRLVEATPGSAQCTVYAEVELACLVAGNQPGARALVGRELRELAAQDAATERIRETVSAYLDSGGNVEKTASALFVHKNTIRYRLAQAEELIGHPLTERRTEISLALRALPYFPPAP